MGRELQPAIPGQRGHQAHGQPLHVLRERLHDGPGFAENDRGSIFEVAVATDDGLSGASTPQLTLDVDFRVEADGGGFDVSSDGQLFVVLRDSLEGRPGMLDVVTNWFTELKRLAPID